MRAVLYCRRSEESGGESTSLADQEADLRALAEREGWTVEAVLRDDGLSGRFARERADAALAMIRDGSADVLAVWRFDRWSRQGLPAVAALLDVLDERPSALFVALKDNLRSGQPAWRIIAAVLAEVARDSSQATSQRVRASIASRRRAGRWTGGPAPYGYASADAPDGRGRILVPEPSEAKAMATAARRIVEGESLYAVTRWLNGPDGPPPRRAAEWTIQAVRQTLTGPAIVGRVMYRGDVLRDSDGMPATVFAPAIPVDLWLDVGAVLGSRSAAAPSGERQASAWLLSGLVTCGGCGAAMHVRYVGARNGRPGLPAYRCPTASKGKTSCAIGAAISAAPLDAYVAGRYLATAGRLGVVRPVEDDTPARDLVATEAELSEVSARLGDPALSDEDDERLSRMRRALRARVRSLREAAASAPRVVRMVETGESVSAMWERLDGDVAGRRALLAAAFEAVVIGPGTRGRRGLDESRVSLVWRETTGDGLPVDAAYFDAP